MSSATPGAVVPAGTGLKEVTGRGWGNIARPLLSLLSAENTIMATHTHGAMRTHISAKILRRGFGKRHRLKGAQNAPEQLELFLFFRCFVVVCRCCVEAVAARTMTERFALGGRGYGTELRDGRRGFGSMCTSLQHERITRSAGFRQLRGRDRSVCVWRGGGGFNMTMTSLMGFVHKEKKILFFWVSV
ncbi:hypothetical protein BaRGS_00002333 [Batillaria attramentaria]|uniref:Uncharacterized protein n=1 Tax=Batillaria attramentaria TaxID=370345 RepID=A0ABD0M4H1_9CAEN